MCMYTTMPYHHDFKNDEFADKYIFKGKKHGYFVEVGALDGITCSQCYYFENELGWDGIAVEPQRRYRDMVKQSRRRPCFLCLGDKAGTVNFTEAACAGLSGVTDVLKDHEKIESHKVEWRDAGMQNYEVSMITLLDMLAAYNAPQEIDYLGMDCEGSEFNILTHFFNNNNGKYNVKFICLEVGRMDLVDLVCANGYVEVRNPILPDWNGKKVTWERYFVHVSCIDTIDQSLIIAK